MRAFLHSDGDAGYSLAELVAALGLLGIILGVAWLGFSVSLNGTKTSDRQAWFSREVGAPLEQAEKVLMQQYRIDNTYPGVTPYRILVNTDRDNDDNREDWELVATADHRFVITNSEIRQDGTYETSPKEYTWSSHNYNIAAGVPLLRFYDSSGNEITSMGDVSGNAARVVVTIVTEYDGKRFQDSRTITFRNQ